MFLLGVLSFAMFAFDTSAIGDRMSFGITMVLTIIAFQFVIASSLPKVDYLTLIDWYNLFIFGCNCAFIMESFFLARIELDGQALQDLDDTFLTCAAVLYAVGHVVFSVLCFFRNKQENQKMGIDHRKSLKVELMQQCTKRADFNDVKDHPFRS